MINQWIIFLIHAFSFVLGVHRVTLGEGGVKTLIHKQMLRIIRPLVKSNATHYVYFNFIVEFLKKEKYTESVKRLKIPGPEYTYLPTPLFC